MSLSMKDVDLLQETPSCLGLCSEGKFNGLQEANLSHMKKVQPIIASSCWS